MDSFKHSFMCTNLKYLFLVVAEIYIAFKKILTKTLLLLQHLFLVVAKI